MKIYPSFEAMVEAEVLPQKKGFEDRSWLDETVARGQSPFAFFRYKDKLWRINSDSRIGQVLKAYDYSKKHGDPFMYGHTPHGTPCLTLQVEIASRPKHIYIYYVRDL